MATATDFPLIRSGHPAPDPVLTDVVVSWLVGADTAAVRPVGDHGVLGPPWFLRIGRDRLADLAQYASIGADDLCRLRVLRDLP